MFFLLHLHSNIHKHFFCIRSKILHFKVENYVTRKSRCYRRTNLGSAKWK